MFSKTVHSGFGAHPTFYSKGTEFLSGGGWGECCLGRDDDHLRLSNAEFTNEWSYTSTVPVSLTECNSGTNKKLPVFG